MSRNGQSVQFARKRYGAQRCPWNAQAGRRCHGFFVMAACNYHNRHGWHGFTRNARRSGMQLTERAESRVFVAISGDIAKLSDSAANG